jgi:hypothetical protein
MLCHSSCPQRISLCHILVFCQNTSLNSYLISHTSIPQFWHCSVNCVRNEFNYLVKHSFDNKSRVFPNPSILLWNPRPLFHFKTSQCLGIPLRLILKLNHSIRWFSLISLEFVEDNILVSFLGGSKPAPPDMESSMRQSRAVGEATNHTAVPQPKFFGF